MLTQSAQHVCSRQPALPRSRPGLASLPFIVSDLDKRDENRILTRPNRRMCPGHKDVPRARRAPCNRRQIRQRSGISVALIRATPVSWLAASQCDRRSTARGPRGTPSRKSTPPTVPPDGRRFRETDRCPDVLFFGSPLVATRQQVGSAQTRTEDLDAFVLTPAGAGDRTC